MIYRKCEASDIEINTQTFSDLFIRVYNMNFPNREFNSDFGYERVKDIIGYVNDNTATIYGAFDGDKLAGFIWGYKRQINDELRIHVPVLVVSEQHQRKGIARQLMELMKSYASDCGIDIIEVMVTSSNEDAIKYYDNVGFKEARKLLELRIEKDDN